MYKKMLTRLVVATPLRQSKELRCYSSGVLGNLILFFRRNPEESFLWEDLEVRFKDQATEAGIFSAVRSGILAGALAGTTGHEFTLHPGPYLDKAVVIGEENYLDKKTQRQIYSGSLQHLTVLRFRENPSLVLPVAEVLGKSRRLAATFGFSITEKLLEVFKGADGLKYLRAGDALATSTLIPGPSQSKDVIYNERRILEKFVEGLNTRYSLASLGLTLDTVEEEIPNLLSRNLVELRVGDANDSYICGGPALANYLARLDLAKLKGIATKFKEALTPTGAALHLLPDEHKILSSLLEGRVKCAKKVLASVGDS